MFGHIGRAMSDDYEKFRLEQEVKELRKREWQNARGTRIIVFLAVWILPLFGMELVGYEPKAEIGPMSIWGAWFLAVPIGFWLYCRFNRTDKE